MNMGWNGWPLDRVVISFLAGMFFLIFVQVTLFHYRQNFRHWSMWVPVIATPVDGFFLTWLSVYNADGIRLILTFLLLASTVAGAVGSFLHSRGVGERVGGYELRNFMVGPPVMLPGLITASSLLGLAVLYWPSH